MSNLCGYVKEGHWSNAVKYSNQYNTVDHLDYYNLKYK
jgi:hypothetical protein